MIELLNDFPGDVLAVRFGGEVTAEEFRQTLVPQVHDRFETRKHLAIYAEILPRTMFSPAAVWEDWKLGLEEFGKWGKAAVVSDEPWVRSLTMMMAPLFHPAVRIFPAADAEAAKAWVQAD